MSVENKNYVHGKANGLLYSGNAANVNVKFWITHRSFLQDI